MALRLRDRRRAPTRRKTDVVVEDDIAVRVVRRIDLARAIIDAVFSEKMSQSVSRAIKVSGALVAALAAAFVIGVGAIQLAYPVWRDLGVQISTKGADHVRGR